MQVLAQIDAVLAAGHADHDHVAVPIALLRDIRARIGRREAGLAQLAAAAAIGDIGRTLPR